LAGVAAIVLMLLWLAGAFHSKIAPDEVVAATATPLGGRPVVNVSSTTVPYSEWAVGSTEAVYETTLGSRLLAKVVAVNFHAGQLVQKGDKLVELDDADLRAQLDQATAVVAAAAAALDQARIEADRITRLIAQQAATQIELTRANNALKSAEADHERAEKARVEAETRLSYAIVRAPMAGRIVDKRVNVGDTVSPGQPLVSMYDHTRMRLVAVVRESLAHRLALGQMVGVRLESMKKTCQGEVEEIVPQATAATRSFEVKVSGPCPPGVYPGMFGRIEIPLDPQEVISIPRSAVMQVGQLDLVDVVEGANTVRRLVRLGREMNDNVEVLGGLKAGEQVVVNESSARTKPQS
jgi:RND family efflux transporter MFP subunit